MKCVLPCDYNLFTKILVVGNTCVGKTSLLHQLTSHEFEPDPYVTIGVEFVSVFFQLSKDPTNSIDCEKKNTKDTNVPDTIKTQIWDCAGQMKFQSIVTSYFREANIVIFVYDITEAQSFYDLKGWNQRAQNALFDKPFIKQIRCT
jgi:small GTP-binding protein